MDGLFLRVAMALMLALGWAGWGAPAHAVQPLLTKACVLGAQTAIPLARARQADGWNCAAGTDDLTHRHLWMRIDGGRIEARERLVLRSDALHFGGLLTVVELPDGSVRQRYHDAEALARQWTVGTRFAVPLIEAGEQPRRIWLRVDEPLDRNAAALAEVVPGDADSGQRFVGMVLFALFAGMMLVVAVYSLALSVALRSKLALWHGAMSAMFLVYTVSSSSLAFMFLPDLSLWARSATSYLALAFSIALVAPFFRALLEDGMLPRWAIPILYAASAIVALAGLGFVALAHQLPFVARPVYHAAYLPVLAAFVMVCVIAWRRGSRIMRVVTLAWSVPALVAVDRILRGMNIYLLPHEWDFAFYAAMAWQSVIMAIGITLRIGLLRLERDLARAKERSLGELAQTDGLTGLPNRRAFDERDWRGGDFLAIVDADHFKQINDRHGHQAGDRVLAAIGAELRHSVAVDRGCLAAFRMGGEEFALLVAARSEDEAALIVNAVRQRVCARVASLVPELAAPLTVSAGVARIGKGGIDAAYQAADRALYKAKNAGRDRLCYEMEQRGTALMFPRRKHAA